MVFCTENFEYFGVDLPIVGLLVVSKSFMMLPIKYEFVVGHEMRIPI